MVAHSCLQSNFLDCIFYFHENQKNVESETESLYKKFYSRRVCNISSQKEVSEQSYEELPVICNHTVLPATRRKYRVPPNPSQASWYSIYLPRRNERPS